MLRRTRNTLAETSAAITESRTAAINTIVTQPIGEPDIIWCICMHGQLSAIPVLGGCIIIVGAMAPSKSKGHALATWKTS